MSTESTPIYEVRYDKNNKPVLGPWLREMID